MTPAERPPKGSKGSAEPTPTQSGAGAPVEPTDALRRIAYLLERSRAETYKVRAFRTAADAVGDMPDRELAAHDPAGSPGHPRRGQDHRAGDHRGQPRRGALVPPEARGVGGVAPGPGRRGGGAAVSAAGRLPQPLGLVGRRQPDPGDGRGGQGARAPLLGPHRPQPTADRRPRAQSPSGSASSSTWWPSSTRSSRRSES